MFKTNIINNDEAKTYIWKFPVITNRRNVKELIIIDKLIDITDRSDIILKFLNISRYGIPCYVFDDKYEYPILTNTNDKSIGDKEYCHVNISVTDKIYTITPYEYIPNIPTLNINAPEFVPNSINITKPTRNFQDQYENIQSSITPKKTSKLNINDTLRAPDSIARMDALRALAALRAPVFIPSKTDIYQNGPPHQLNMKYY